MPFTQATHLSLVLVSNGGRVHKWSHAFQLKRSACENQRTWVPFQLPARKGTLVNFPNPTVGSWLLPCGRIQSYRGAQAAAKKQAAADRDRCSPSRGSSWSRGWPSSFFMGRARCSSRVAPAHASRRSAAQISGGRRSTDRYFPLALLKCDNCWLSQPFTKGGQNALNSISRNARKNKLHALCNCICLQTCHTVYAIAKSYQLKLFWPMARTHFHVSQIHWPISRKQTRLAARKTTEIQCVTQGRSPWSPLVRPSLVPNPHPALTHHFLQLVHFGRENTKMLQSRLPR